MYRFFILWFLVTVCLNANILEVGDKNSFELDSYLSYTLALDVNETVDMLYNRVWSDSKTSFNTFANSDNAYWVKLSFKNGSFRSKKYYLQVENQPIYHIEFFLLKNNVLEGYLEDGAIVKRPKRIFNDTHILFPIELVADEKVDLFIKIRNFNKNDIRFMLVNERYLLSYSQSYTFLEALFFGGMFIILLYNIFLYTLFRLKIYLYYLLYIFWSIIYFFGSLGYITSYFPDFIYLYHLSSGALLVSLTLFIKLILKIKEQLPRINYLFNFFIIYFFTTSVIYLYMLEIESFFYTQIFFDLLFVFISMYAIVVVLSTYYLAFYRNFNIAKIYSFVWSISLVFILLFSLMYLNLIDLNISIKYFIQYVVLFEALCFSFILVYQMKVMEKEKRREQKIFLKKSKLALMGEMISLIAHQWRQPLSQINGVVLNMDFDDRKNCLGREKLDGYLTKIEDITAYLSKTIDDFIHLFSSEKKIDSFYICDALRYVKKLLPITSSQYIKIEYTKGEDIELFGYKSELVQSLLIVINNSIYACLKNSDERAKIVITIDYTKKNLLIFIEDNGGGIDEEVLKDIFTPYFSTKGETEGTGLGLYILKMIIEESMYGKVSFENINKGVVCSIKIPLDLRTKSYDTQEIEILRNKK